MVRLMDSPPDFVGPVNIGNPDEFSMLELAQLVQETVGTKSNIQFCRCPKTTPSSASLTFRWPNQRSVGSQRFP